jgi:hypothetical protein
VIERRLTERAVAIPALGWRLRVEPRQIYRFGSTLKPGTSQTSWDSRRYRGAGLSRLRQKARSTSAVHSLSSSNLVTDSRKPIGLLYAILRIVSSYPLVLVTFVV